MHVDLTRHVFTLERYGISRFWTPLIVVTGYELHSFRCQDIVAFSW